MKETVQSVLPNVDPYKCSNSKCIKAKHVCDGKSDCLDGKDENMTLCDVCVQYTGYLIVQKKE